MKYDYMLTKEELFQKYKTSDYGLTEESAAKRLDTYGYNEFKQTKEKNMLQKFIDQFKDILVIILIIAAFVSFFLGEKIDALIIILITILNAVLGVAQENKAEKSLTALKKMSAPKANVVRDGKLNEISTSEIVPGDIVMLDTGRYVPADLRIISSTNLKIDESSLTGESLPSNKISGILKEENIPLGDRNNMAYMSSVVTYGRGIGLVVDTGMKTEIGKIADMISNTEKQATPLQKRLDEVGKYLGIGILVICFFMFLLGILEGRPVFSMFMTAISLAVAAIPEGLPAVVTIVLAAGMQKMIKRNAIIRKLPAVETLGCATIICSDKTGTLTQNKMTVKKLYTINGADEKFDNVYDVLKIACLCNDTKIVEEDGKIKTLGDPTETALVEKALKCGIDKRKLDKDFKRVDEIPFDSKRKLMTTFNRDHSNISVNIKGAPDIVLDRSAYILDEGKVRKISEEDIEKIKAVNNEMSKKALRVLAFGFKIQDEVDKNTAEEDIIFAGLMGMIDPPREEAKDAVKKCKNAGIKTVMITGDYKLTAVAVAKELGILKDESEAISGSEIDNLSADELKNNIGKYSVYARVSPEHKVNIVNAWKAKDQVVAMTGDGINDAPALKMADIGAAMGITGTDVAKEAADMILMDDNFATIVSAVEEGRTIYSNIRKAITYLLSCNIGEIFTLFTATLLGWLEPLLPIHILWINLVTDSLPALALGMDPPEKGIMDKKPRDPKKGLFSDGLGLMIFIQGIIIGVLSLTAYNYGLKTNEMTARTMAFFTLGFSQLVHSFNMRTRSKPVISSNFFANKYLNWAFVISSAIQMFVMVTPFMRSVFKVSLLSMGNIMVVIVCSLLPLLIMEAYKAVGSFLRK